MTQKLTKGAIYCHFRGISDISIPSDEDTNFTLPDTIPHINLGGEGVTAKEGFARLKAYRKSGASLYVPERVYDDAGFPFKNDELLKVQINGDSIVYTRPDWWELIDWKKLPDACNKLPTEIREKIRKAGLI